jgi:hypothetical protein
MGRVLSPLHRWTALLAAAFALCVGTAAPAAGQQLAARGPNWPSWLQDVPRTDTARVEVRGEIAARCELSLDSDRRVQLGSLVDERLGTLQGGEASIGFDLVCNHPFRYVVQAEHGALRLEGGAAAAAGVDPEFLSEVPYAATVRFAAADGPRAMCDRDRLIARGQCAVLGRRAVTRDSGEVTVRWEAQSRPLLAGRYADRLRIHVSPLVSGE